jgi:hypothetical protein
MQTACGPLCNPLLVTAGLHADIPTLATLRELGMPLSSTLVCAAALSGRLNILQHVITIKRCPIPERLGCYAARSGSISMLKWLRVREGCFFDRRTCAAAAEEGHLAALQHLRSEGYRWDCEQIAHNAARSGSIEVMEWLQQQHGVVIDARVLAVAAAAGHITLCEHLRSTGCDWDAAACNQAAKHRQFDMVRWLRGNGCPWDLSYVCISAAGDGCTDMLDYVIEQGEVLSAELLTHALNAAGTENQLQAAQWLRQHGAEWPALLGINTDNCTQQWSGDTLEWARAEGCTSPV